MRNLTFWAILFLVDPVLGQTGQYSFAVIPSSPNANQGFQIRVNLSDLGCVPLPAALQVTSLGGNVMQYEVHVPDSCFPFPPQERTYAVGGLPEGQYMFRFAICPQHLPPLPGSTCSTISTQAVAVSAGAGTMRAIPALSLQGLSIITLITALLGLAVLWRRPGFSDNGA